MTPERELRLYDATETRSGLPFCELIPALEQAFRSGLSDPDRHHHHEVCRTGGSGATLLLMPAWRDGGFLGTKIATVQPDNGARGLPSIYSTYFLADAVTGQPLAILDGGEITARRTVAVSALAASRLAREDSETLLLVGAGRVSALTAAAMREVRPIRHVLIWNRSLESAEKLACELLADGFEAEIAVSLPDAATRADIVSCATLSHAPLIRGEWLGEGTHLDLIGSFTPQMREVDDRCIVHARIFVDTWNVLAEAGDLTQPIAAGLISARSVVGSLSDLVSGTVCGRPDARELTLFKSVGTATSDLAAGALAFRKLSGVKS